MNIRKGESGEKRVNRGKGSGESSGEDQCFSRSDEEESVGGGSGYESENSEIKGEVLRQVVGSQVVREKKRSFSSEQSSEKNCKHKAGNKNISDSSCSSSDRSNYSSPNSPSMVKRDIPRRSIKKSRDNSSRSKSPKIRDYAHKKKESKESKDYFSRTNSEDSNSSRSNRPSHVVQIDRKKQNRTNSYDSNSGSMSPENRVKIDKQKEKMTDSSRSKSPPCRAQVKKKKENRTNSDDFNSSSSINPPHRVQIDKKREKRLNNDDSYSNKSNSPQNRASISQENDYDSSNDYSSGPESPSQTIPKKKPMNQYPKSSNSHSSSNNSSNKQSKNSSSNTSDKKIPSKPTLKPVSPSESHRNSSSQSSEPPKSPPSSHSNSKSYETNSSSSENPENIEEPFQLKPSSESQNLPQIQISLKIAVQPISLQETFKEIPCMIELKGFDQDSTQRAGVDIICVIDVSGSMSGKKLSLVNRTLNFMIKRLDNCDRVSLITFSNRAKIRSHLICTTAAGKEKLSTAISKTRAAGGTEIISGITKALNLISTRQFINQTTSIILLTDGIDNSERTALKRFEKVFNLYNAKIQTGFVIHTFGYGADHQADLLNAMASRTNGGFYYIEEESFIPKAFSDCLGEMMSVVADSVQVELVTLPGVIPFRLNRVYSETGDLSFRMPPVLSGSTKETVFTLVFCDSLIGECVEEVILKAKVEYRLVKTEEIVKNECFLTVVVRAQGGDEKIDENVLVQFYRARCAEVLKTAADWADRGGLKEARETVLCGIQELKASGLEAVGRLIEDLEKSVPRFVDKKVYESVGRADLRAKVSKTQSKRCEYKNSVQTRLMREAEEEFDSS